MSDSGAAVALSPALVRELFPFMLAFDREMRVAQFGPAVSKICANVRVGAPASEVFSVERPRVALTFDAFRAERRSQFLLAPHASDVRLRGQVVYEPALDLLLFVGAPWVTSIEQLSATNLRLDDFPVYDPIVDFLYVVQAHVLALADARAFSETIAQQRDALEQTNRELARASEAKSQFLATTSHELRTPLNGILGMAALLARSPLTPAQRNQAEKIIRSGRALLTVLNDVLDFSKIEAGRLELEVSDFDVAQLAHEVSELFAPQAEARGVELVCDFEGTPPGAVRGDPNRLRQVLSNLIGNAVKFTEQGEIVVRLISHPEGEGAMRIRFEVADTGEGIPKDRQRNLFRPFSQVDGSMTRRHGGTGLGLAICKQLAALMGGDVGVESEAGRGSTFWFSVRLDRVEADSPPRVSVPIEGPFSRARVLVVDDNDTARKFLVESAARWGLRCDEAASAVRGLELLRAAQAAQDGYRVAVVDAQMPGMTGTDLLLVMAGDAAFAGVRRVLLVSAEQEQSGASNPSIPRADRLLTKPVRASQLYDCLVSLLSDGAPAPARPAVVEVARSAPPPRRPERILVADDNAVNREVAVAMLDWLGFEADAVGDGRAAVEAAGAKPYALVLMDLQMPVLDGYAATGLLREGERGGRRTPVVALTAHAMESDRTRALAAGMDDYLAKPLSIEALADAVRRWVPGPKDRTAPRDHVSHDAHDARDAPDAHDAEPAIDASALDQVRAYRRAGGPDLLVTLVTKYLDELPGRAGDVRAGLAAGDAAAAAAGAHALKSSSALVGARGLSRLCAEIEALGAGAGDAARLRALAQRFESECGRVRAGLSALAGAQSDTRGD